MISIAGNEIFPSVLKRVFNAENVAENNYVMQAAVKKFWKFFARSATEKSFAKFRRAANHNFFGDITAILRRCVWTDEEEEGGNLRDTVLSPLLQTLLTVVQQTFVGSPAKMAACLAGA